MKKKLKLFVWENVLRDYTPGMMVALAHDVEEARTLLRAKVGYNTCDLNAEPQVVEEPAAFYVSGGG